MKQLAILGTGSIGTQTLDVVRQHPEAFAVYALTAHRSIELLVEQAREFHPAVVCIADEMLYSALCDALCGTDIQVMAGEKALAEIVTHSQIDVVVAAMVGYAGLLPTIEAIRAGKTIALANKETLVVAGEIICHLAKKHQVDILPVDSEHSAIFQSLVGEDMASVEKLLLTASGGPFRKHTLEQMHHVTAAEALRHPNWDMGAKITIDSATMMNKGLEIIEAKWLFGTEGDKINVVVHPESIIHSMVEYADGSVIAQMGHPDMREAIQFAFSFPDRLPLNNQKLDFAQLGNLSFYAPDIDKFPALGLAYQALEKGGNMTCVMNAANEAAVAAFLQDRIGFYEITDVVQECMAGADFAASPDLDAIFATNEITLAKAEEIIRRISH